MKLKEYRLKNGLYQREFAYKLGIAPTTYLGYEKEKRNPTPEMLCRMADILEVTVDELLGRVPERTLFTDARMPKTEIEQLYDQLTPHQQEVIVEKMKAYAEVNEEIVEKEQNGYTINRKKQTDRY